MSSKKLCKTTNLNIPLIKEIDELSIIPDEIHDKLETIISNPDKSNNLLNEIEDYYAIQIQKINILKTAYKNACRGKIPNHDGLPNLRNLNQGSENPNNNEFRILKTRFSKLKGK
jgi:hypothetical protein